MPKHAMSSACALCMAALLLLLAVPGQAARHFPGETTWYGSGDTVGIAANAPEKPIQFHPGDVLRLKVQTRNCRRVAKALGEVDRVCAPESATLVVDSSLGKGGLSEVYAVTVRDHTLPTPASVAAAAAEDTPANVTVASTAGNTTAVAAAAVAAVPAAFVRGKQSLEGRRMALKVSKKWSALSNSVQKLYGDDSVYYETVNNNTVHQHWIMSSRNLGAGEGILQSYMAGTVYRLHGQNSTEVPPQAVLMDLAQGGSLQGLVEELHWRMVKRRRSNEMQAQLVHQLIHKVLGTLNTLHNEGWAHLDLKLGNVVTKDKRDAASLLQSSNAADALMLIDFGSAVYLGKKQHKPGLKTIYTVSYASPELQRWSLVSRKADVWSLGVLMLSLRTGAPPSMKHTKCPAPAHRVEPDGLTCADQHASVMRNLRRQGKFRDMSDTEWDFVMQCLTLDWEERPSAAELLKSDYIVNGPGI